VISIIKSRTKIVSLFQVGEVKFIKIKLVPCYENIGKKTFSGRPVGIFLAIQNK